MTTLETVLPLLKKVKGDGKGGYTALCPAHDDSTPSLSIRRGDKQAVILQCRSRGCSYAEVMGALGLANSSTQNASSPPTYYEYHDENGGVLYRAVRRARPDGSKSFSMQTPDGRGGWIDRLPHDVRRLPYRLPDVIEAIAEDRRVYVCEGEKDCETAREYGLVATTNIGGAGKWGNELSVHFKDASVIILPDNDAPGRDHAQKVAHSLNGITRSVRIVKLPGLQEKGDLTDWLCEGHLLEELERLVDSATDWTGNETEIEDGLPLATCALHAPEPEPIAWAVADLLIAGEPALFFGDGGDFKSTLALHTACAVAGGYRAFGQFETAAGAVLVVSAEDSAAVLHSRAKAMCRGHGWNEQRVLGHLHYYALEGVSLTDEKWCARLRSEVERLNARLVVLDPMQELVGGTDQNSASEMAPVIKTMRGLCRATNAAVLLLHHAGKAGNDKRTIDRIRGSSAIHGAVRAAYFVSSEPGDKTVRVECVKMSRAERQKPFVLRYSIESDPSNSMLWSLARFEFVSVRQAEFDKAQTFVLEQIDLAGRVNTTDLKNAAKGTGVNALAISGAIKSLEMLGAIDFEEGPKGSKLWGRKTPALVAQENPATTAISQLSLPGNQPACPATSPNAPAWLPNPLGGQPAGNHSTPWATSPESGEAA